MSIEEDFDVYPNDVVPEIGVTYWCIERIINGQAHWWMRSHNQYSEFLDPSRWTTDIGLARKYTSKTAAEYVLGYENKDCVVTGHSNAGTTEGE